jgi:putative ABC transport system ATP-binding protein
VAVIGSNGAGKSTFLNAISGDLLVDTGKIEIDGTDVTRKPAWDRAGWWRACSRTRWPAPARR